MSGILTWVGEAIQSLGGVTLSVESIATVGVVAVLLFWGLKKVNESKEKK